MPSVEFSRTVIPRDLRSYGDMARRAEEMGWDAISTGDNTCLLYDPFVCLAAAAAATRRVLLMTDVTNSVTRHASVIAAAAGSLQDLSGGRFVLGIGRGDSAIHFLGLEPASVAEFATYVTVLQSYLAGHKVMANGVSSQITWLQRDPAELITPSRVVSPSAAPKVPLSIAATGPKITGLASRLAERVTLNVGADPRRIARSINHIRESRAAAGLDPQAISIGAYLLCAVDDDEEAACRQVRGLAAVYIRFSAMNGRPLNDLEEADAAAAARVVRARETMRHGSEGGPQALAIDRDLIRRFAVVGPARRCADRIAELCELGLDHIHVVCESADSASEVSEEYYARFAQQVLPVLRPDYAR